MGKENIRMCEKCVKVDEMIGQTFGKLTVLERAKNSSSQEKRYLCECKCGNRKIIRKSSLVYGRTKSCGKCKEPKPGDEFGSLTVVKKLLNLIVLSNLIKIV